MSCRQPAVSRVEPDPFQRESTINLFSLSRIRLDSYCIEYSQPGTDNKRFNLTHLNERSGRLLGEKILTRAWVDDEDALR